MKSELDKLNGAASAGAPGSANDDGRVYEYTGRIDVLHNGTILIPRLEESPGRGEYRATIILWPNSEIRQAGPETHDKQEQRNTALPASNG